MKRKRILSLVIVFAMMIGLMATMPTKANAGYETDLWVGGVRVGSANDENIAGPNIKGTVSYDVATNTLTLENAEITGPISADYDNDAIGICSKEDLTIVLKGANKITSIDTTEEDKVNSYAIYVGDNLTIKGDGTLTAHSGKAKFDSKGIYVKNNILITDRANLDITVSDSADSIGIYSFTSDITIENSTVKSKVDMHSYLPCAVSTPMDKNLIIKDGCHVTLIGYNSASSADIKFELSDNNEPNVLVDTDMSGNNAKKWDGITPLGENADDPYKYIKITTDATPGGNNGGTYLPTGNMNWNLFGPAVVKKVNDDNFKETIISFTVDETEYVLNKVKIAMDGKPYIKSDRIMLPLRYVAEAMGMKVEYDNDTRFATFKDEKRIITINVDTGDMTLDGKEYPLEVKPELKDDRIYLPLGLIADALGMTRENPKSGYDVSWYQDTKTCTITIKR